MRRHLAESRGTARQTRLTMKKHRKLWPAICGVGMVSAEFGSGGERTEKSDDEKWRRAWREPHSADFLLWLWTTSGHTVAPEDFADIRNVMPASGRAGRRQRRQCVAGRLTAPPEKQLPETLERLTGGRRSATESFKRPIRLIRSAGRSRWSAGRLTIYDGSGANRLTQMRARLAAEEP